MGVVAVAATSRLSCASTNSARRLGGTIICASARIPVWVGPTKSGQIGTAPRPGYRLRFGRRPEPITVYARRPRRACCACSAASTSIQSQPSANWTPGWWPARPFRPDAARLFRSRPPSYHNPLAEKDGQPGVAFRWMEVEGPIYGEWPTAGHKALFGDLPLKASKSGVEVVSANPSKDAEHLLRAFLKRAYREAGHRGRRATFSRHHHRRHEVRAALSRTR